MKRPALSFLTATIAMVMSAAPHAGEGALDILFGSNGKQTTSFSAWNDEARDVARQTDGKIVLAGRAGNDAGSEDDFALLRYNADGQLDTTFGVGGKITTAFFSPDNWDVAEAVAIQADGKIVAAGWSIAPAGNSVFALARYLSNGQLDTSFGANGLVTTNIRNSDDFINDIAIQADGKIVVTGGSRDAATTPAQYDFVTVRYLANGQLDTSFDGDGIAITPIGASDEWANGIVIQRDGKVVVAGASCNAGACDTTNGNFDFAFVRYNSNGSLDGGFNDDGKATFATAILTHSDGATRLALQADDSIVAAGGRDKGDADYRQLGDFALVRIFPNGQLDTSFGDRGWVRTPIGLDASGAGDIAYRNDGKLVVAGSAIYNAVNADVALALYNRNGSLDQTFGTAGTGIVTTPIGAGNDYATGVTLQPDGKIVIAGGADSGSYRLDFTGVRYEGHDVTATAFSLGARADVEAGAAITAQPVTVSGISAPTLVLARNGEYSINNGPFTSAVGTVNAGDIVTLRHTSSSAAGGSARSTLHIGGMESDFTTTTRTDNGGGGSMGLESLALLTLPLLGWYARRRERSTAS
ncbi:MAG: delta-60 repeat domain-containing protein [Pseudomonadota bacterium]